MKNLIFVGLGGFMGAGLRYLVSVGASRLFGEHFPYGTLLVNVAGGLLIGLFMELSLGKGLISPALRLFLVTGILGGLTTFSTFSYETVKLFSEGRSMAAILNACLNLFLSLAGVLAGRFFVR